jgi:hypothetical protein
MAVYWELLSDLSPSFTPSAAPAPSSQSIKPIPTECEARASPEATQYTWEQLRNVPKPRPGYQPHLYFNQYIHRLFGLEKRRQRVPDEVVEIVRARLDLPSATHDPNFLELIRAILKENHLACHYPDVFCIASLLGARPPPQLDHDTLSRLRNRFKALVHAWDRKRWRHNLPSYPIILDNFFKELRIDYFYRLPTLKHESKRRHVQTLYDQVLPPAKHRSCGRAAVDTTPRFIECASTSRTRPGCRLVSAYRPATTHHLPLGDDAAIGPLGDDGGATGLCPVGTSDSTILLPTASSSHPSRIKASTASRALCSTAASSARLARSAARFLMAAGE